MQTPKRLTRRMFVATGTTGCAAALGLPVTSGAQPAGSLVTVDAVRQAGAANLNEVVVALRRLRSDIEAVKATRVPSGHFTDKECADVQTVAGAVVATVVAVVVAHITAFTGGQSTVPAPVTAMLDELKLAANRAQGLAATISGAGANGTGSNKMTPALDQAFRHFRSLLEDIADVAAAGGVFLKISKDTSYTTQLLDAVRARNRAQTEALLKQGPTVPRFELRRAAEENGFQLELRLGRYSHCLSTRQQCGGRSSTLTKF